MMHERSTQDGVDWRTTLFSAPAGGVRVGGDWCDAFPISQDADAVTIGDVAGHGQGVAETMRLVRASVLTSLRDGAGPSQVLSAANAVTFRAYGGETIATAVVGVLNRRLRTLTFANAGHPAPLMMTASRHGFLADAVGDLPLGIFANHRAADYVVAVPADALIILYTDGITEHDRDILRGEGELVDACRIAYDLCAPDAASAVARRVFQNVRGHDDAAVVALRAMPFG
ncbi:MAG TPA: PP2C family protein-serine/threonine phosphatase, partial [Candidatus Baltobacteraceae bacterium]|nr:PP2C family protein-serine/threonine phosphatase [Candidatus Baltobacteraceae bacterium]